MVSANTYVWAERCSNTYAQVETTRWESSLDLRKDFCFSGGSLPPKSGITLQRRHNVPCRPRMSPELALSTLQSLLRFP